MLLLTHVVLEGLYMWAKFFECGARRYAEMSNPSVGHNILKLQIPSLLIRVDGRGLEYLHKQDGLLPRVSIDHVKSIRFSHVEQYQKYNEEPFAWGACASLKDLLVFIKQNESHAKKAWIHKFYGKGTSLLHLKYDTGIESEGHDNEKEVLVVTHVPFKQFIASTCPKYREKFLEGGMVPNAMAEYNSDLPKVMRMSDLYTEQDVLAWLLVNKSEQTFIELCKDLYSDVPKEALKMRFDGNIKLVDTIDSALAYQEGLKL